MIHGKNLTWGDTDVFLRFAQAYGVELSPLGERYTIDGSQATQVFRANAATEKSKVALAKFARDNGHLLGRVVGAKGTGARREYVAKDDEFTLSTPTPAFVYLTDRQQIELRAESAALELELRFGVKV